MVSLIFVPLIASIVFGEICCNTMTTTEEQAGPKQAEIPIFNRNENSTLPKQFWLRNIIFPRQRSLRMDELKKLANTKYDSTNRKSKLMGSLAFLAGLGVGGLAGAASRVAPHVAAIYNPYHYLPQPYILASPLGFYPLVDPPRLQTPEKGTVQTGVQAVQTMTQNQLPPQVLSFLDNKNPIDLLNINEDYPEEAKKTENEKTSSDVEEETDESAELRLEDDRNAEVKIPSHGSACESLKTSLKKQSNSRKDVSIERGDLEQDADDSLAALSVRQANATVNRNPPNSIPHFNQTHHHRPTPHPLTTEPTNNPETTTQTNQKNETVTPFPFDMNNTTNENQTVPPPIYGYYGGNPQDLDHVDLTTETDYRYPDYGHINYNLPYDRPANFYPDDRYNYYSNPPVNSFQTNQFHRDQIPEYFPSDFSRLFYAPEKQQFSNGFRPIA